MTKVTWTAEAENALARVPLFVRPMARHKVEKQVQELGRDQVTQGDVEEAERRFRAVLAGKDPREAESALPRTNEPGVQMVTVEGCHGHLNNCPNLLLDAAGLSQAINSWIEREGISERLRQRVADEKILFHHKFRIAIAGCPNGCSRPQIADIGLVGFVTPEADPRDCSGCGACARACPDEAITLVDNAPGLDPRRCQGCTRCRDACAKHCIHLSPVGIRILAGGKLGRHPHLAETVCEVRTPAEAIAFLDRAMTAFAARADSHQRFADFWVQTHGR